MFVIVHFNNRPRHCRSGLVSRRGCAAALGYAQRHEMLGPLRAPFEIQGRSYKDRITWAEQFWLAIDSVLR